MNVLVIPEDFRKDQYMLKPIVAAMLNWVGVAARVEVCQDPLLGGVTEAMKWERIKEIIEQYSWKVQLFLLCIDRDSDPHRRSALDNLEQKASQVLPASKRLLAENAWQEIEVWVLAVMTCRISGNGQRSVPNEMSRKPITCPLPGLEAC
jgi:hypothetical protein